MLGHTSFRASLAAAFQIPLAATRTVARPFVRQQAEQFSTTSALMARKKHRVKRDPRLTMIRYSLYHPTQIIPRVLRLGRLRTLRHWTVMRAWSVHLASKRNAQQMELERMWNSMRAACEDLRVGLGDDGRLFRQAMTKKGVFGGRSDLPMYTNSEGEVLEGEGGRVDKGRESGIPIEYARGLTDTPSRDGWDEQWTR